MAAKIIPIRNEIAISTTAVQAATTTIADPDDKHVQMMDDIGKSMGSGRKKAQRNLTPVVIHHATRTNKLALVMAPMWGPQIAPYGIARLAGLSRFQGFETKCWDVNINCYNQAPELWSMLDDWKWGNEEMYYTDLHPRILPVLEDFLNELVIFNPTIIGFSTYYTNIHSTQWLCTQIKERLPDATIVVGGPESRTMGTLQGRSTELYDYVIRGEGELNFSKFLDDVENNVPLPTKYLDDDRTIKIDLDSMPIPDYRDFNINLYQFKGVASELSRGCIAKCTFCRETTYWRYRGRLATSVLDEVEYNYRTFGIEFVWFIDSLVNGNLNELLAFAQGLIDRNIKVNWYGFGRNDKRMTREYIRTIVRSGCAGFAVGVETGSQKVSDLIQKKVKIEDVEQNFKDFKEFNFDAGTSWFVGFPGEMLTDFAQTLTLVWRLRNSGVASKGFVICALDPDSPITTQPERFGISNNLYNQKWYTTDWTNTVASRAMRYKFVNIFLNHYRLHNVDLKYRGNRGSETSFIPHHNLSFNAGDCVNDIEYEIDFDYAIIKTDINPLADSLVNEIWPILRVLWRAVGAFKFDVKFDPELDFPIMGDNRYFPGGHGGIWADYKFSIDAHGNWDADFYIKLDATDNQHNFEHTWIESGNWKSTRDITK